MTSRIAKPIRSLTCFITCPLSGARMPKTGCRRVTCVLQVSHDTILPFCRLSLSAAVSTSSFDFFSFFLHLAIARAESICCCCFFRQVTYEGDVAVVCQALTTFSGNGEAVCFALRSAPYKSRWHHPLFDNLPILSAFKHLIYSASRKCCSSCCDECCLLRTRL